MNTVPSRFLNLSDNFEFAGWGSFMTFKLSTDEHKAGDEQVQAIQQQKVLGQFTASALAGNAVLGSVFYAFPSVTAVAGALSPISLLVSAITLFLWRPVMEELADALPIGGAPYSYILNSSTKAIALAGAALLLLDYAATSIVSAATAVTYIQGEVTLPFPAFVATLIILGIFTAVSLCGVKESARVAFGVLLYHVLTMLVLIIVACVHWSRTGLVQLQENWETVPAEPRSIVRQIFYGFCLGMLGLTGFECTPAYVGRIKPGRFPQVLRNLHLPAIVLGSVMMLLVIAIVPMDVTLGSANILSALAQLSAGRWLRLWVVVDSVVVLSGGVLTGILSACELLEQLSRDRILPKNFTNPLPFTGAPYLSVLGFVILSIALYASTGASLTITSKMFSLVWLTVMTLFPLALITLQFNRGRLQRTSRTPFSVIVACLAVAAAVFAGNVAIDQTTVGYFALYFVIVFGVFTVTQKKTHIIRYVYWLYDNYPSLHSWGPTQNWGTALIRTMKRMKRQPVCILAKTDEINYLFQMILYVRRNEETSCLKIVHFADEEDAVPSELEANAKILDEAFPELTIDLLIVRGTFDPATIAALALRLNIPTSLMFMSCPGSKFPYSVSDLGTRIICR
ncbi:amino acid permease-domain-containing protein [Schizophyllum amplum]|uniref:Amino acid permease-domain-containing protein n=1 Tax=Schizophyllum amplum TaxID=97359 RepID=A0A550CQJ3_9AGAR|nr:amino acid permease-domain-containing protein [Auriculariopsis ampla]